MPASGRARELAEAFRLGTQLRLTAGRPYLTALVSELDVVTLGAAQDEAWRPLVDAVQSRRLVEAAYGSRFVTDFRIGQGAPAGLVVPDVGSSAASTAALRNRLNGLIRSKAAAGYDLAVAAPTTRRQIRAAAEGLVARGARGTVERSATTVGRYWRRVTDGDPCAFCAMLASRGPVYGSKQTAETRAADGRRYHDHCGCTAVEAVGPWGERDAQEWAYYDNYKAAYRSTSDGEVFAWLADHGIPPPPFPGGYWFARGKTRITLGKMRASGLYRDSPAQALAPRRWDRWEGLGLTRHEITDREWQIIWKGDELQPWKGRHEPGSKAVGKTHTDTTWNEYRTRSALQLTIDEPQYAHVDGTAVFRRREVDRVIWHVQTYSDGVRSSVSHAYPLNGDGVTVNTRTGPRLVDLDRRTLLPGDPWTYTDR
jgi:hypothetical protein